jgi:hypothetical protein
MHRNLRRKVVFEKAMKVASSELNAGQTTKGTAGPG